MHLSELASSLNISGPSINTIRQAVVSDTFANHIGSRALLLMAQYPFLIIGPIIDVISDFLVIDAEVTNVTALDGEQFRIHIDDIEVFYIETADRPIPDIRDGQHA